jgi:uncharacterized protein
LNKKKAILFGDYSAKYHPVAGIYTQLQEILANEMDLSCTDDKARIRVDELDKYDLCISYIEFGDEILTNRQTHALLSYVSGGGGFLVIHNGISLQSKPEFSLLLGAKFTGHPDYIELPRLQYNVQHSEHPIVNGISDFAVYDEPYQFELDNLAEKTILMTYQYGENNLPAAWALSFGLGKVVYLAPGHNEHSLQNPMYRNIIQNSAIWSARAS